MGLGKNERKDFVDLIDDGDVETLRLKRFELSRMERSDQLDLLSEAAMAGHVNVMEFFLKELEFPLTEKGEKEFKILHDAIFEARGEMVNYLLDYMKEHPTLKVPDYGDLAIDIVESSNPDTYIEMIDVLAKRMWPAAEQGDKDARGDIKNLFDSAIEAAVDNGYYNYVRELLDRREQYDFVHLKPNEVYEELSLFLDENVEYFSNPKNIPKEVEKVDIDYAHQEYAAYAAERLLGEENYADRDNYLSSFLRHIHKTWKGFSTADKENSPPFDSLRLYSEEVALLKDLLKQKKVLTRDTDKVIRDDLQGALENYRPYELRKGRNPDTDEDHYSVGQSDRKKGATPKLLSPPEEQIVRDAIEKGKVSVLKNYIKSLIKEDSGFQADCFEQAIFADQPSVVQFLNAELGFHYDIGKAMKQAIEFKSEKVVDSLALSYLAFIRGAEQTTVEKISEPGSKRKARYTVVQPVLSEYDNNIDLEDMQELLAMATSSGNPTILHHTLEAFIPGMELILYRAGTPDEEIPGIIQSYLRSKVFAVLDMERSDMLEVFLAAENKHIAPELAQDDFTQYGEAISQKKRETKDRTGATDKEKDANKNKLARLNNELAIVRTHSAHALLRTSTVEPIPEAEQKPKGPKEKLVMDDGVYEQLKSELLTLSYAFAARPEPYKKKHTVLEFLKLPDEDQSKMVLFMTRLRDELRTPAGADGVAHFSHTEKKDLEQLLKDLGEHMFGKSKGFGAKGA
ncbi:MAG: hypothetical protein SFT92_01735 [Rickettsiales bacterium]|nr:hypothetical protein [Rickettsiales bacterium]